MHHLYALPSNLVVDSKCVAFIGLNRYRLIFTMSIGLAVICEQVLSLNMQNQCVHFLISKSLAFLTTCYISLLPRLPPHWNTNIESVKAVPVAWSQAFVTVHFFYHLHAKTGGGNSLGMRLPNSYLVFQKAHHNMIIEIFPPTLLAGVILP